MATVPMIWESLPLMDNWIRWQILVPGWIIFRTREVREFYLLLLFVFLSVFVSVSL